jgi:hypothetical protein
MGFDETPVLLQLEALRHRGGRFEPTVDPRTDEHDRFRR